MLPTECTSSRTAPYPLRFNRTVANMKFRSWKKDNISVNWPWSLIGHARHRHMLKTPSKLHVSVPSADGFNWSLIESLHPFLSYRCRGFRATPWPLYGPHEAKHWRLRVAASENIWQQIQHCRHPISAQHHSHILSPEAVTENKYRKEEQTAAKHKSLHNSY